MLTNPTNRRKWLKQTAMLAGGLPLAGSLFSNLASAASKPAMPEKHIFISDRQFAEWAPLNLKARLLANENPFGPSDKAKKAIIDAIDKSYQYPIAYLNDLSNKIADYEGVQKENVLISSGSSPLLHAAAILYSKPGSNIITGETTYEDLPSKASQLGAKWVKVPLTKSYSLDLDAMEKAVDANTTLIYICNPNNPTGTVVDADKLKAFCERVSKNVTIFVDEAYIDYLDNPQAVTLIDAVRKNQNVIVARTFSKLYGFAGLRVGYIVAKTELIKKVGNFSEGAFSISATSIQAALAAYNDKEFLQSAFAKTMASKNFLYEVLKKEGYDYIPSSANFVLFPIKMDGQKFVDEMMKRSVGVRNWKMVGKDWCRISIGRMDEMQAFADAFKEIS
jgi:histidinol-phosphate aminotransferase